MFIPTMQICVGKQWYLIEKKIKNIDFLSSYYLSFLREKKDGYVTLYDYHLSSNVFNMSREENRGFCGQGSCLGNGVLNISTCYLGRRNFAN